MAATYCKLRDGGWGVRVIGDKPDEGDIITVTLKNGDEKEETIARVFWTGETDDGDPVHLCEIVPQQAPPKKKGGPSRGPAKKGGKDNIPF